MNLLLWKSKRLVYDFKSVYPNKSIQNNQYSIIVMCLVTWDHSGNLPQDLGLGKGGGEIGDF